MWKEPQDLAMGGYAIHFAESSRSDGGCIMRGNDLLEGTADVVMTDSRVRLDQNAVGLHDRREL